MSNIRKWLEKLGLKATDPPYLHGWDDHSISAPPRVRRQAAAERAAPTLGSLVRSRHMSSVGTAPAVALSGLAEPAFRPDGGVHKGSRVAFFETAERGLAAYQKFTGRFPGPRRFDLQIAGRLRNPAKEEKYHE